jgi:hypothetical protein
VLGIGTYLPLDSDELGGVRLRKVGVAQLAEAGASEALSVSVRIRPPAISEAVGRGIPSPASLRAKGWRLRSVPRLAHGTVPASS